jgi:GWxTD domain-containing protein
MRYINLILFLIIFSGQIYSQENKLKFDYDYAVFMNDQKSVRLEFYYSFYQPSMIKINRNNKLITVGNLSVKIFGRNNNLVDSKSGRVESVYDSSAAQQILIGKLEFILPADKYKISVYAIDEFDSTLSNYSETELNTVSFLNTKLSASDIQLANQIEKSNDESSLFYKNTLDVEPNPTKVFSYQRPVMFYYVEYYNVKNNITADYTVVNSTGKTLFTKSKQFPANENSLVDAGSVNIADFPSGIYSLNIKIYDKSNSAETSKKFFVFNPDKLDTITSKQNADGNALQSEFFGLSDEELNLIFRKSEYVANEKEKKDWKKLTTADAKKNFLIEFWRVRDENPVTPINETKIEYFNRVDYAQQKFAGLSQKEGWKTDRGRVYIVYGKPNEIERYPNESDSKPYEIWRYEAIEGGVIFVFADQSGYSDYRLIHSTKRGEFNNPDWQKQLN